MSSRVREQLSLRTAQFLSEIYRLIVLPYILQHYHPDDPEIGANEIHEKAMELSAKADKNAFVQFILTLLHEIIYAPLKEDHSVGGVALSSDLILAAGWIKGHGYLSEFFASMAYQDGTNIIPGHASTHKLVPGGVEFGSFTLRSREGNPKPSMWRKDKSVQNRVGLRNPGAETAAKFLKDKQDKGKLPEHFGINIAITPGYKDSDIDLETADIVEAIRAFTQRRVFPSWFTLNVSCPNTEDDPEGNQTDEKIRAWCGAALAELKEASKLAGRDIPLWVKVSPGLNRKRLEQLMILFAELGVRAVVATNTRPEPAPNDPSLQAGMSGRALHVDAVKTTRILLEVKQEHDLSVDVIGSGGVEDGATYLDFDISEGQEVAGRQFLSSLLFRGPWAGALILHEARQLRKKRAKLRA